MAGRVTPDLFDSPALPLLLRLEADGYQLEPRATVLRVRPVERVTPALRAELTRYKPELLLLLRCCDPGVLARRDVMRAQLDGARAGVPPLLFRPDVPYVLGRCFSCGDALEQFSVGRCWRCSLAWRLACRLPVPVDLAVALDAARVAS